MLHRRLPVLAASPWALAQRRRCGADLGAIAELLVVPALGTTVDGDTVTLRPAPPVAVDVLTVGLEPYLADIDMV